MPDLQFQVQGAEPVAHAASPMLAIKLRIVNQPASESVHSIILRCQVQIQPLRRQYTAEEERKLLDLFGERERWSRTMRPLLWTNTSLSVPGFNGATDVSLELPCTLDFNVAATKYFYGLETGEISLELLFSGTIFYSDPAGALQVSQIPWDREAQYRLPVRVWQSMMEMYYPNSAWLRLERDTFDRLVAFRARRSLTGWEAVVDALLADHEQAP